MAETLGLAVNILTIVDLFIKIGVQCSEYCANLKTARRDVRDILNEADRLTATLKELERSLDGPNGAKIEASENIRHAIADSRLYLDDLAVKLKAGLEYKRIKWPLMKGEVDSIIHKLERCRAAISMDLQVHQTALLLNVHQELCLAKLRTAEGASFDSHADADNVRCHPGTRVDILHQIMEWGLDRNSECIFWLNGKAGTGKSTISRTVAQSFADKNMLGASFFFKRGEGERGRAVLLFTTLAAQLVYQRPALAPFVRDAIEAEPKIHEKFIREQFDKLIATPINKLPAGQTPAVIVVDALDECDGPIEHIKTIIYLISQAKDFSFLRLKFFVTSRPELPIRLGFKDIHGKYQDLVLNQIPKPIIEQDITEFLKYELARIRQDYNKSVDTNRQLPLHWPSAKQIHQLVGMAIPLFIFAATVCRFIQDRRLGSPKSQLSKALMHWTSRKSSLDATYLPVLDQLLIGLPKSEQQEVVTKFKQVVGSIVILASPLSTSSLARLLAVDFDIEDQLDLFHSVLSIPPDPSNPVRLFHLSFREFLTDPEKGEDPEKYPFWVEETVCHKSLAVQCLELLSTVDVLQKDICGIGSPGTCRSEINQQTINICLPPEVQYACQYWVYHWKEGKHKIKDGDIVDCFLKNYLLYWLEALALLGKIAESIVMVDDLVKSLDPGSSQFASAFLYDMRRFILTYHSIIDRSPLQIYSSALIFAPELSIIRKTYQNRLLGWVSLFPQVNSEWDACQQTLEGHTNFVKSVVFSPDGKLIASASGDNTVRLWASDTGQCQHTLEGHTESVWSVVFSPDGKLVASASVDNTVRLWASDTGQCQQVFQGYTGDLTLAFTQQNSMYFLQTDKGIFPICYSNGRIIDTNHIKTLPALDMPTQSCPTTYTLSKDGRWIVFNGNNLLWLPADVRPSCFEVFNSTMIIGCQSGRVVVLRLSVP